MALYSCLPCLDESGAEKALSGISSREADSVFQLIGTQGVRHRAQHVVAFSLTYEKIAEIGETIGFSKFACDSDAGHGNARPNQNLITQVSSWIKRYILEICGLDSQVGFRVYLDAGVGFLGEFLAQFCEVRTISRDTTRISLVEFWPVMGISDFHLSYTVVRVIDLPRSLDRIEITKTAASNALGMWRSPRDSSDIGDEIRYSPMRYYDWGVVQGVSAVELFVAFREAVAKGILSSRGVSPTDGKDRLIAYSREDHPDFVEYFLASTVYPRLAEAGVLTVPTGASFSPYMLLDIEFCSWINSCSSCLFELKPFISVKGEGEMLPILRRMRDNLSSTHAYYRSQVP